MSKRLLKSWRRTDFRVDYYRGSGAGGQNRNKLDTAVRITDIETGLFASCEEQRTQGQNRKIAFQRLAKKLVEHHFPSKSKERAPYEERIRTYHEPRGTVKDHRTNKTYDYDDVVKGNGFGPMNEDSVMHGAGQALLASDDED